MSMDTPRISVIIPVFNMDRFLSVCLDSILAEGVNKCPYEVIVVNDASTDGSDAILADYEKRHPNLRVVRFERNRGVSAARNAGLDHARGEYVMFCDPDDAFVPGAVSYIDRIARNETPDVVFFRNKSVSDSSETVEPNWNAPVVKFNMTERETAVEGFDRLFSNLWTWNGVFHRQLFSNLRFDERLWPSEDVLWGVQCSCRCRMAVVSDAVLYKSCQHSGSCSHRVFFSRVKSEILGIGEFYEEARKWPFFAAVKGIVFSRINFRAFGRTVSVLLRLPTEEKNRAWNLLFDVYQRAFRYDIPVLLPPLYWFSLRMRSRFLVRYVISLPPRLKYLSCSVGLKNAIQNLFRGKDSVHGQTE